MRIAFYAPLKAPDDPVPSGDRELARLLMKALRRGGHEPWIASRVRTLDLDGDRIRQQELAAASAAETKRVLAQWDILAPGERPAAWLTYHVYYKAPDWIGPVVAQTLRIPYVVVEGSRSPKRADGSYALAHRGSEAALEAADTVFYKTDKDYAALAAARRGRQELIKLPPFLDPESWPERRTRTRNEGPARFLTVAMMRRGNKSASYHLLARALAEIAEREWVLDIVGDGQARAEIETAFARFGSKIRLHGVIDDRERLADLYSDADLFLWPAVREPFGMVFLEAQLFGVPPVAGCGGGTSEAIRNGETGLLVEAGDPSAFAEAVVRLMDSPQLRLDLSLRARRFVREERLLEQASDVLRAGLERALQRHG